MARVGMEEFVPKRRPVGATNVTARKTDKEVSRRGFLKKAGLVSGALGIAGLSRGVIAFKGDTERGRTALKDKFGLGVGADKVHSNVGLREGIGDVSAQTEFNLVFGNLGKGDQETARLHVNESRTNIEENMTVAQLKHLASFDKVIRLSAAGRIPDHLLFGLVVAESKGNERVISQTRAKGLTQMMVPLAEKYGLLVNDDYSESDLADFDERYVPEKILPVTARELEAAYSRYGNWGFAVWEWHLGAGNLYNALTAYFTSKDLSMPSENYREFLRESKVTVYDVLTNPSVANMFAQGDFDQTQEYVYNVLAGSELYRDFERSLVT